MYTHVHFGQLEMMSIESGTNLTQIKVILIKFRSQCQFTILLVSNKLYIRYTRK